MWARLRKWAIQHAGEGKNWAREFELEISMSVKYVPDDWLQNIDHVLSTEWKPEMAEREYFSLDYFRYLRHVAGKVSKKFLQDSLHYVLIDPDQEPDPEKKAGGWKYYLYCLVCVHESLDSRYIPDFATKFPFVTPRNIISDGENRMLTFVKSLAISSDQFVQLVVDDRGREWVLKAGASVAKEKFTYEDIRKIGGQTLDLLPGKWFYGNKEVIVMEKLIPLDEFDDEFEMASQILTTQLYYLNTFAVHADLKPDNIMKRNTLSGKPRYFIIDMDVDDVQYPSGQYRRQHFTPLFHWDKAVPNCSTTFHADLRELYATLVALLLKREYKTTGLEKFYAYGHSEGIIVSGWKKHNVNDPAIDPLMYISEYIDAGQPIVGMNEIMSVALFSTPFSCRGLASYIQYINETIPLGAPPNMEFYETLANILKENDTRLESGIHPSQLPPRQGIQSCLRCGEQTRFVEAGAHGRAFCNDTCQRVFYEFH